MTRRLTTMLLIIGAMLALPGLATVGATEKTVIRLGTLAPKHSTWDKVFSAWNNSIKKESGGALEIELFLGGAAGDEKDVIRKMKISQLDAGAFTTVGLSQIAKPIGLLTTPGLVDNYKQLNQVREALAPDLEAIFDKEGYKLLGWGDAGFGRVMSNRPILMPQDYKSVRPWVPAGEQVFPEFMKIIGANGVSLGITEVFPQLQVKAVDTLMVSALAAVALQWFRNVTHIAKEAQVPIVGATLVRKELFASLPPDQAKILVDTGKKAHAKLIEQVAKEDQTAYDSLSKKMTVFSMAEKPEQVKAWGDVATKLRANLTGKLWTKEFFDKTTKACAEGKKAFPSK